ncbi:MAG: hypothetical protein F9K44_01815 [Hyphomicrobiaceae bacterium]|jgi:hypothetical protein|nr:MAG: hypothetical protein F9K44_01815 [Hyphomicrobiaceae bacterium]
MFLLRLLGSWFVLAATLALVYDVSRALSAKAGFVSTSLGEHWFKLHVASLNLLQAMTERYVSPKLWDPVLVTILHRPTWLVLGVIGVVLFYLGRQRRRVAVFAN